MPASSAQSLRLFADKGGDTIYAALLKALRARVNPSLVFEDPKSTCVHINAGKNGTAYAGVHPRTGGLLLNIVTAAPLKSKRIRKAEQRSRNRCHCEVLVTSEKDIDNELLNWLEEAAHLVSQPTAAAPASPRKKKTARKSSAF
ncbi:MAG TPA: DUF5655 domain-containing protein [Phycisphaerales bacterium]|nr:DUF5655 domain-containing protein [Phycisphaerales bacterium]